MHATTTEVPVAIVGAGPAGLAAGASLRSKGIDATIFESGDAPGNSWRRLYARLHLHTIKHFSGLPGMPMPRDFPRYPSRLQVVDYLSRYAQRFNLTIETDTPVTQVTRESDRWCITTPRGEWRAHSLVSATGVFSQPLMASYPGMESFTGRLMHSADYFDSEPFAGQRVLVIGVGNSGAEIAVDLSEHGVQTMIAIRNGANVVPRELLGMPIQVWAHIISHSPRALVAMLTPILLRRSAQRQSRAGVPRATQSILQRTGIPVIGLDLLNHTRDGSIKVAGAIDHFTETGVQFRERDEQPFDVVIMATGFRPALSYLDGVVPLDAQGRPALQGVRSVDVPNLYFIGMNYDIRGTLFNIGNEAPLVAKLIAAEQMKR